MMEVAGSMDEYEKLVSRMNTPRVVVDNAVCATATLVKVDSGRKHGMLLEAVQVLTDLNLSINKSYISSDGRWFMDVFHVTDRHGHKVIDDRVISQIEKSLGSGSAAESSSLHGLTALELTGADRPGLLSEVFAVLANLQCTVAEAKVWTHNGRIAAMIFVKDADTNSSIEDAQKVNLIEMRLRNVLKGDDDGRGARTALSMASIAHAERRLHQMMFADRDYEQPSSCPSSASSPSVSVQNWVERGYSIVNVQSRDRPKLLFDVLCTLTDMEYVVFHGVIDTDDDRAHQEFYIRHADGSPISSEAERQRVVQCLQAAIERRASEGLRLELCTVDRPGLLSEVTRTFRENGLSVTRAEVSTTDQMAANVFFVMDAAGNPADPKMIDSVRENIGLGCLKVNEDLRPRVFQKTSGFRSPGEDVSGGGSGGLGLFYLGSFVRRNLYNLGLIRSCS